MIIAQELDHLRIGLNFHVCSVTQALDQVLRHAIRQVVSPMDEAHTGRARGEEHGSLPCGISSPNHNDLLPLADASLQFGGRIVDPCAL